MSRGFVAGITVAGLGVLASFGEAFAQGTNPCAAKNPCAASARSAGGTQSALTYRTYGADSRFKIEWQPDQRRGKPIVSGYVTNQGWLATNVRLLVEALDTADKVTATYIGYLRADASPGTRIYFEVPVQAKAPSYRVAVLSFNDIPCNGG